MNHHGWNKRIAFLLAAAVLALVAQPVRAEDARSAATGAMLAWLHEIDQGKYVQSWNDASTAFRGAVTSEQWVAALSSARTPLGNCNARNLVSAEYQTEISTSLGRQKGEFFVAKFNSVFENLAGAVETLCFEKAPDGTWKASGYYVRPKL